MQPTESAFPQPAEEQLKGFVEGDPIAIDAVVRLVLVPLVRWAKSQYSGLPEQEIESLLHQVLGEICVNHSRYDPSRAKFTTYVINLYKLRVRDLMNRGPKVISLDSQFSKTGHEKHPDLAYNYTDDKETDISTEEFFQRLNEHLDDLEQEFIALIRSGIKDTDRFAEVLSRHTSVDDPSRQVKNTKERLQRKLRSLAKELGYTREDFF